MQVKCSKCSEPIALTDIIDTQRSLRLEIAVVVLIVIEVVIGCIQILAGLH